MNYPQSAENRKGVNLRLTLLEDKTETIIQKHIAIKFVVLARRKIILNNAR